MIFAETHGVLGHTHDISLSATQSTSGASFNPFLIKLNASGKNSSNSSCILCFCYRLLGQSLIPQTSCIVNFPSIVRIIPIRHICLIQINALAIGNRGPPQA
jgi:hypothetical protein